MKESLTAMLLNPVRMRIMQYLLLHPNATAAQIGSVLADVPQASLYRHLNKLLQAGALCVVEQRRVRGAVEKVYAPNDRFSQEKMAQHPGNEFLHKQSAAYLLSLMGEFERYFQRKDADPAADFVMLRSAALFLTDEEMISVLRDIGAAFDKVLSNRPEPGRRLYRFGITALPLDGGQKQPNETEEPTC